MLRQKMPCQQVHLFKLTSDTATGQFEPAVNNLQAISIRTFDKQFLEFSVETPCHASGYLAGHWRLGQDRNESFKRNEEFTFRVQTREHE